LAGRPGLKMAPSIIQRPASTGLPASAARPAAGRGTRTGGDGLDGARSTQPVFVLRRWSPRAGRRCRLQGQAKTFVRLAGRLDQPRGFWISSSKTVSLRATKSSRRKAGFHRSPAPAASSDGQRGLAVVRSRCSGDVSISGRGAQVVTGLLRIKPCHLGRRLGRGASYSESRMAIPVQQLLSPALLVHQDLGCFPTAVRAAFKTVSILPSEPSSSASGWSRTRLRTA
jgi:hypothetical protein